MAKIYLVRHGHAASGFDTADPGLDELGRTQAEESARALAPKGPLRILTSPLKRARETALPLAREWKLEPIVETAAAEIPTPSGMSLSERVPWLRKFMAG
ncbi:MAG: histidine phosphatase family protein, partial [Alphaproteobacteria bacterium]|nr:histidine phosphatase family protein [Alphaproteobacteria bacterium]